LASRGWDEEANRFPVVSYRELLKKMRSCRKRQFIFLLLVPLWGGFLFFSPFSCRDARAAQENEVEFEHPPARNGKAFLEIKAGKTEAYLQEKIPLCITLYVKESRVKDIRYPQLNNEGLAMEEFPQPLHQSEFVNGILYDTSNFRRISLRPDPEISAWVLQNLCS
jgi:hypothetical protein